MCPAFHSKPPPPQKITTTTTNPNPTKPPLRTVFVIEYLGPILIMLAYATRPSLLYGTAAAKAPWAEEAKLGVACWIGHFVKVGFCVFLGGNGRM